MPLQEDVTPDEWRKRTAVWSRSRGETLRKIDEAYKAWYESNSPDDARQLWSLLETYLVAHGGHWDKIDRNKASKGLMADIHQYLAGVLGKSGAARQARVFEESAAHARLGVLYLFSKINVEIQDIAICLEGALNVTNVAAPAIGNSYGRTAVTATATVGLAADRFIQSKNTGDGDNILATVVPTRARSNAQIAPPPPPPVRLAPPPGLVPVNLLIAGADALFPGPMASVRQGLSDLADWLEVKFHEVYEWCRSMVLRNQRASLRIVNQVVGAAVKYVLKAAVPFIGGALNLKDGVMQVISAAKQRIQALLLRRKFVIQPGHPEVLANTIETTMNWSMAKGLWSALKGAAELGLTFISAGASVLANVVAAAMEFIIKTLMRLDEAEAMQEQLKLARDQYAACSEQNPRDPTHVRPKDGSLATDAGKFTEFYQGMCDASPCIPILTLNSSICGSLTDMIKLFDDTSSGTVISQASFNAATEYFKALKIFGNQYLQQSGFRFVSNDPKVSAILAHAVKHHGEANISGWDKALGLLGG